MWSWVFLKNSVLHLNWWVWSHHNQVLDLSMDMDTQFFEVSMDAQILKFGYRTKFCIFGCVKNIKDSKFGNESIRRYGEKGKFCFIFIFLLCHLCHFPKSIWQLSFQQQQQLDFIKFNDNFYIHLYNTSQNQVSATTAAFFDSINCILFHPPHIAHAHALYTLKFYTRMWPLSMFQSQQSTALSRLLT